MEDNYWVNFWKQYTVNLTQKDEQTQVLRTLNKEPISTELWDYTLKVIDENFKIKSGDSVLDLCSGNGLLAKHFVGKGAKVTAVDISDELLNVISNHKNIKTITSDIRDVSFNKNSFDHIVIYAGIQYLNNKETILLLKNMYSWLKPNGTIFIGDIPDIKRRWEFFNNDLRQKVYYDNVLSDKAIVGNWFEKEWFDHLKEYIGFSEAKFIEQDNKLFYSKFRFDYLYKK